MRWAGEFIALAGTKMIPFVPALVGAILPCLAHTSGKIRRVSGETNGAMFQLVVGMDDEEDVPAARTLASSAQEPASPTQHFLDYSAILSALTNQFSNDHEATRIAAIDWISMLQTKAPHRVLAGDGASGIGLLKLLSDPNEEVVRRDVALLAQIASGSDADYFHRFVDSLLKLFFADRHLLETRGTLIIRLLCNSLDSKKTFITMASILEDEQELEFASLIVQHLSVILLTGPETINLRRTLRDLDSVEASSLFVSLYRTWSHNAAATLALCFLAQAYEHASNLVHIMLVYNAFAESRLKMGIFTSPCSP